MDKITAKEINMTGDLVILSIISWVLHMVAPLIFKKVTKEYKLLLIGCIVIFMGFKMIVSACYREFFSEMENKRKQEGGDIT